MRTLTISEINAVTGSGVGAVIIATPIVFAMGIALTGFAIFISPIVVSKSYYATNSIDDSFLAGLNYISLVPEMVATVLEAAYIL